MLETITKNGAAPQEDLSFGFHMPDDIDGELGGLGDADSYNTMYRTMEWASRLPMDNLLGFMGHSQLTPERKEHVQKLLGPAMAQWLAPVNWRFTRLRDMRLLLEESLGKLTEELDLDEDEDDDSIMDEQPAAQWEEKEIMSPLPISSQIMEKMSGLAGRADVNVKVAASVEVLVVPNPARRALSLIQHIIALQREIERDIAAGVFQDYTRVLEALNSRDPKTIYHASLVHSCPSFLQRVFEACQLDRAGRVPRQWQALMGRMLEDMPLELQSKMRGAQKGRFTKRFGRDHDDDGE